MKLLDPKTHGYLDYGVVGLFLLAPSLFDFRGTQAASISYALAVLHLFLTLITAFPLGMIKAVPFTVHGWIEFAGSLALVAMPWMADFAYFDPARNFYVGAGIAYFILWVFTDYKVEEISGSWAAHHGLARR